MALRNLAEDCTDSNFNARLTAPRRNAIMKANTYTHARARARARARTYTHILTRAQAVNTKLAPLLNMTFSYLGLQFSAYRQVRACVCARVSHDARVCVRARLCVCVSMTSLSACVVFARTLACVSVCVRARACTVRISV